MMRVQVVRSSLATAKADALNRESGRIYTSVLVWHYRVYRRTGHWLTCGAAQKLEDYLDGPTILHAHSRDAAQQGFYDACDVARSQKRMGLETRMRYPHRRKVYRPTTWKNTGIRVRDGVMILAQARGQEPIQVTLPHYLLAFPANAYKQVELVWDRAGRHYNWHITLDDSSQSALASGAAIVAVDLGEIHPATLTDGKEAVVITARRLRAAHQYTAKRLAGLQAKQAGKKKHSSRWKRLQRRKNRFLAQQKKRTRDIEHKVSRGVVGWAAKRKAGLLAIGDVRDVADGKRFASMSQQKIGMWSHGKLRQYLTYKAEAAAIRVEIIDEHNTSKTCPCCGRQYKPRGRVYRCSMCGLVAHRDVVGSVNILSRKVYGKLAKILPPPLPATRYRHPSWTGKRSP